jgi:predicted phage terminase large subunit-like protein
LLHENIRHYLPILRIGISDGRVNNGARTTWLGGDTYAKLNFPQLKRFVLELAGLYSTDVVLVEDKASGTSLIQELHAESFSIVEAASSLDGDKIMRLHAQTAKIEGGFVLFPQEAPWLDAYIHELVGFPNAKNDDQVDSTVFALAWSTPKGGARAWLKYMKKQVDQMHGSQPDKNEMFRVWLPPPATTHQLITGRQINVPENRIVEMTEEEFRPLINGGARRVD